MKEKNCELCGVEFGEGRQRFHAKGRCLSCYNREYQKRYREEFKRLRAQAKQDK